MALEDLEDERLDGDLVRVRVRVRVGARVRVRVRVRARDGVRVRVRVRVRTSMVTASLMAMCPTPGCRACGSCRRRAR